MYRSCFLIVLKSYVDNKLLSILKITKNVFVKCSIEFWQGFYFYFVIIY